MLQDSGFTLTDLGESRYSFTLSGTKASILTSLSEWNLLEKVTSLQVAFG